jgi:hypothetical protein
VLGDLKYESVVGSLNLERVENRRKFTFELHVDDGSDDLGDFTVLSSESSYEIK